MLAFFVAAQRNPVFNKRGKPMRVLPSGTISRGTFIRGMAGSVALAAMGAPFETIQAAATDGGDVSPVLPAPRPIPGGLSLGPGGPFINVHEPGTAGKTLPYTQAGLEGLDVEPITITDFKGVIAQAYHVGSATGSDGMTYNLETDIRVYQGEYIADGGSHHRGTFALL
jgi:hypothetical protein